MDNNDLIIDTQTNASKEITMRITHLPTRVVFAGKGMSRIKLERQLIKELENFLKHR